jgi:hypothetical protein
MSGREGLVHPELATAAARHYLAHLEAVEANRESEAARRALRELIETTESAIRLGPRVAPDDFTFTLSSLKSVAPADLTGFINQFQLGLGRDDAPVVAMGTEVAGDVADPRGLAYNCLQTALILAGSPEAVVQKLLVGSKRWDAFSARRHGTDAWRPPHIYFNDLEQVQRRRGTHTWTGLARVIAPDGQDPKAVLAVAAQPSLGDLAYLIERSGYPARKAIQGRQPEPDRTLWLEREVMPTLRETATVLIIYGYGRNFKQWLPGDQRLFEAFLGRQVHVHSETVPGGWLWHDSADGRLVVYMDAPSGSVSHAYLDQVRHLVQEYLSAA